MRSSERDRPPEGLESIGYNAFDGCSALERIDIPASVTYVGEAAFVYCTGLKEAVIGDGVAEIAKRACSPSARR